MKIRCVHNKVDSENFDERLLKWANTKDELEISVGKVYVVLAISRYDENYFYYILSDESIDYPLAFPVELFEITDKTLSKYWDCNLDALESFSQLDIEDDEICSISEWRNQKDFFYEKLLDDDNQTVSVFENYRDKALLE
ncbi:MAG: hypothetical protein ABJO02_16145 [Reichenbachiella sp.]|uniref:hypothetical protein n=1 Tax=Reichenbachiella sp. TaxID=2184521 RepID=UPI003297067D